MQNDIQFLNSVNTRNWTNLTRLWRMHTDQYVSKALIRDVIFTALEVLEQAQHSILSDPNTAQNSSTSLALVSEFCREIELVDKTLRPFIAHTGWTLVQMSAATYAQTPSGVCHWFTRSLLNLGLYESFEEFTKHIPPEHQNQLSFAYLLHTLTERVFTQQASLWLMPMTDTQKRAALACFVSCVKQTNYTEQEDLLATVHFLSTAARRGNSWLDGRESLLPIFAKVLNAKIQFDRKVQQDTKPKSPDAA